MTRGDITDTDLQSKDGVLGTKCKAQDSQFLVREVFFLPAEETLMEKLRARRWFSGKTRGERDKRGEAWAVVAESSYYTNNTGTKPAGVERMAE